MYDSHDKTSRRDFIRLGSSALGAAALPRASGAAPQQTSRKPNVLYVFDDMHRASAMGCYGDPNVQTPTLDGFARQGAILKTAMSSTPVCCPARASLMTGQYSHHHGVVSNAVDFFP